MPCDTQKVKPNVHPSAYILWLFAVTAYGCIQNVCHVLDFKPSKQLNLRLLGAFTCSVVCSGITAFLHVWVDECECELLEQPRRDRRSHFVVKVAYWCNRFAFYLYCVSMPLMGPVYNPSPPPPIPGLAHIALGYHMLLVGAVAAVLDIFFAFRDCVVDPDRPAVGEPDELSDVEVEEVNRSMDSMGSMALLAHFINTNVEMFHFISFLYVMQFQFICLSQCNFTQAVPGSRALLMVGFIQHASARFIGLHEAPDGHAYQLFLNNVFPEIVARPTRFRKILWELPWSGWIRIVVLVLIFLVWTHFCQQPTW